MTMFDIDQAADLLAMRRTFLAAFIRNGALAALKDEEGAYHITLRDLIDFAGRRGAATELVRQATTGTSDPTAALSRAWELGYEAAIQFDAEYGCGNLFEPVEERPNPFRPTAIDRRTEEAEEI